MLLLHAGGGYRIGKKKIETKYRWETLYFILLLLLVGVNHHRPILHMSKRMVHLYSTDERINPFAIFYMINPSLCVNKVFREQAEKFLKDRFHGKTM